MAKKVMPKLKYLYSSFFFQLKKKKIQVGTSFFLQQTDYPFLDVQWSMVEELKYEIMNTSISSS
jgi:hypothetical protein